MAGTVPGGKQAAQTNKQEYGNDFYKKIGAKGGKNGRTGGFAAGKEGRERARLYGTLGGTISRRDEDKRLTAARREKIRKQFEKAYAHLLKVHEKANV